jgi:hypothetical protein
VAQTLNEVTKVAMAASAFQGILLPMGGVQLLMLQYIDDTTFLLDGKEESQGGHWRKSRKPGDSNL